MVKDPRILTIAVMLLLSSMYVNVFAMKISMPFNRPAFVIKFHNNMNHNKRRIRRNERRRINERIRINVLFQESGLHSSANNSNINKDNDNSDSTTNTITITTASSNKMKKKKNTSTNTTKGVYVRPSAAIERGSGFYIPGLEGSRIRFLFGISILILNYINSITSTSNNLSSSNIYLYVSQILAAVYGILLMLQGSIEIAKEMGMGLEVASPTSKLKKQKEKGTNSDLYVQYISSTLKQRNGSIIEAMQWVASSFIAVTSATHVFILQCCHRNDNDDDNGTTLAGRILYSVRTKNSEATVETRMEEDPKIQVGIQNAIDTVHQSKSGRVSIPSTHPSSIALLPMDYRRCVLLQLVNVPNMSKDETEQQQCRMCLLIGSNQLLQSYTKNDLMWLGRLGKYLTLSFED